MNTREAYNNWASRYDLNDNKTRDLEGLALQASLNELNFQACLEVGCGTGKNTSWLLQKAENVTAIDFSEEMLRKARQKNISERIAFVQADITKEWSFRNQLYDIVTFSLVLEHIDNLNPVFKEASAALNAGGFVYVGELHPFKQYTGAKARFDSENGRHTLECFTHHISDFIQAAKQNHLALTELNEHFDEADRSGTPRILTMLFKKT